MEGLILVFHCQVGYQKVVGSPPGKCERNRMLQVALAQEPVDELSYPGKLNSSYLVSWGVYIIIYPHISAGLILHITRAFIFGKPLPKALDSNSRA